MRWYVSIFFLTALIYLETVEEREFVMRPTSDATPISLRKRKNRAVDHGRENKDHQRATMEKKKRGSAVVAE